MFSGVALDQVHGHDNAFVKADGGTEQPSVLLSWMTTGSKVSQMIKEYYDNIVQPSSVIILIIP